jgi:cytochrome c peroxidase
MFQDGYERALSRNKVLHRNTPSILNINYYEKYFLDGRASNLKEQIKEPLLSINELHSNSNIIQSVIESNLDLLELSKKYASTNEQFVITALAEYMKSIATKETYYDLYKSGKYVLTDSEKAGMGLFFGKAACATCHTPPYFTDNKFHRTGLYPRKIIVQTIENPDKKNRFVLGYDYGRGNIVDGQDNMMAFRTPSLINSIRTSPYMHDGSFTTIRQVIDYYDRGGDTEPSPLKRLELTNGEKKSLIDFLQILLDVRYKK